MRKYLLPKDGKFYKANLHMHTNISDGRMTIEETKKAYMEKGYSIVAYTDHEIMVPHNELSDDNFLAITSTEISLNSRYDCAFDFVRCYHLNLYSFEPNKDWYTTFDEKRMWLAQSKPYVTDKQRQNQFNRLYETSNINEIIKMANEDKCLVSYNHPVWSCQDYSDYIDLKGLWAVEWFNNGCYLAGYIDTMNPIDELLKKGERVFPIATDDAHKIEDCFGGFTMIKANDLKYDTIYEALKKGDFYSSTKPLIHELYFEDGCIHIKTSKVKMIYLSTDSRYKMCKKSDELIDEAIFDLNHYFSLNNVNEHKYIRISLVDEFGWEAHTRAYFFDELIKDEIIDKEADKIINKHIEAFKELAK